MIRKQSFKKAAALLSGAGVASAALLVSALGMSSVANAAVAVDADGKVKLFGDVRIRMDKDKQTTSGDVDRERDRTRYRVRVGVSYQPNDAWSGKFRLATTSGQNSPHVTYSTVGDSADVKIGVDTAFIAFTGVKNLTLVAGKTPLNFWQQNEVFWDTDITPEAFAVVYQAGPVTLNAAYAMLVDGGWDKNSDGSDRTDDITAVTYQAVYGADLGGMKLTAALGGVSLDAPSGAYNSEKHIIGSVQLKGGSWLVGADYMKGDADDEEIAYVLQGRFKFNKMFGVRAYYYHVEANATPGDGLFTQDNFPSAQDAADNFKGYRLQLDAKVADNTSIDLRYYDTEAIADEDSYYGQAKEHDRLQLNINVKF